jgi:hypothetical protein
MFLTAYNEKGPMIPYLPSNNLPGLSDNWLLGFTEAEGCFTITLFNNTNSFRTRYILTQKGDSNLPIFSHLI